MRSAATVGDLIHAQARSFRDRAAILQHNQTVLTYGELAERIDLWSAARGQYARIGLCLPAGLELSRVLAHGVRPAQSGKPSSATCP